MGSMEVFTIDRAQCTRLALLHPCQMCPELYEYLVNCWGVMLHV